MLAAELWAFSRGLDLLGKGQVASTEEQSLLQLEYAGWPSLLLRESSFSCSAARMVCKAPGVVPKGCAGPKSNPSKGVFSQVEHRRLQERSPSQLVE